VTVVASRGSRRRRGTFSVESAIILISFVVIASALAFVVMNMGFHAAQKTKETMERGILEATSALELDGSILAYVDNGAVKYLVIPVKTCVAKSPVDMSNESFVVTISLKSATLLNVYNGTRKLDDLKLDETSLEELFGSAVDMNSSAVACIITGDGDDVLELNEKAFIIVHLESSIRPMSYDVIKIELKSSEGATVIISRQIPPLGLPEKGFVDLG